MKTPVRIMDAYFVISDDNIPSWSNDTDSAERFRTLDAAVRRAKKLAKSEPSREFLICKSVGSVKCGVSAPVVEWS